jgi:hypothetical protein
MARKLPFTVKRAFLDGSVRLAGDLRPYDHSWGVKVQFSTDITIAEARELAAALVAEADRAEAKVVAKTAAAERRQAWHRREVEAGRRVEVSLAEALGRRK